MNRLAAMHDCPLLTIRALTAVSIAAPQVGARHHDERIAAAELEHRLLDLPAGGAGDLTAGRLAAGQRRACHPGILQHALDLIRADQQRLKRALRKARAPEHVLDHQRALRDVRRVLEQHDVAGHQRRRGEAEHLPEGKVPRHHGEDRPERLVPDEALGGRALHRFVGEHPRGVLGVEAAAPRALGRFLAARLDELAHLGRHHPAEHALLRVEDLGRPQHLLRPFGERRTPVGLKRPRRLRDPGVDLRVGQRVEGLQGFGGRWIDRGDWHLESLIPNH